MHIRQATVSDVDGLVPLFDAYRMFYKQESDLPAVKHFLEERVKKLDSVIFTALGGESEHERSMVGFVQLYPLLSSLQMQRTWILNDLFVVPTHRNQGIGERLIKHSIQFGKETGATSLVLQTAIENKSAQKLYSRLGWILDEAFLTYEFAL